MKFTMPLLDKDFAAFGDIILESYGALEGRVELSSFQNIFTLSLVLRIYDVIRSVADLLISHHFQSRRFSAEF